MSFIPSLKLNTDRPVSSYYKQHLLPFMSSCGLKDAFQRGRARMKFVVGPTAYFKLKTQTTLSLPRFRAPGANQSQAFWSLKSNLEMCGLNGSLREETFAFYWDYKTHNMLTSSHIYWLCEERVLVVGFIQKTCSGKSSSLTAIGNDATRHWLLTEIWW